MKTKNILTKTMLLSVMLLAALNNYAAYNGGTITIKVGESYHVDASLGGGLVQFGSWSRSNSTFRISALSNKTCTITGLRVGTGKLYYTGYAGAYTADQYWTINVIGNGNGDEEGQSGLTVSASPAGGNVAWGTEVTLTSNNSSATIAYTLDGSDPLTSSTQKVKASGDAITINETCTLKAYAYTTIYFSKSKVYSWNYTVDDSKVGLIMNVSYFGMNDDGTVCPNTNVWFTSSVSDAEIYYTTDGSTPSRNSTLCQGNNLYIEKDMTLKAVAYKDGYKESDVVSRDFILGNFQTGDEFYANTGDDIEMLFKVIDPNKTVQVGAGGVNWRAIDLEQTGSLVVPSMVKGLSVIRIGEWAFSGSKLSHIVLPDGIEEIGDYAFQSAYIEDIVIPKTVTKIGEKNVFYNSSTAPTLNSIQVAEGNKVYDSRNNCNAIIETKTNKLMYGCKNTIVPDDIEIIGYYAFRNTGLKTITLPKTLKSIEEGGLYCAFDTIYSELENPFPLTAKNVASPWSYDRAILYVPQGTKSKYESTAGWKDFKEIREIGEEDEYISIDATNFPDANFRNYLLEQSYGEDGVLTEKEIQKITNLDVENKGISTLTGIEYFTALKYLSCSDNQLSALDVSKNPALVYLRCTNNQITSLNVSKNTALTSLYCSANQLTLLDVSRNTALTSLNCGSNQLTSLDVRNCSALTSLYCYKNKITALDLTACSALTSLYCYENQITSLDVRNCSALTSLNCGSNQLTSLDVRNCSALTSLSCNTNQLSSLDVSNCPELTDLAFSYNQLQKLDVTNNSKLMKLYCVSNLLSSLDISKNAALTFLNCSRNAIKGVSMDALVNDLPQNTSGERYRLLIYNPNVGDESNVCTNTQVAIAKSRGWSPEYYNGAEWLDYDGSDPTDIVLPTKNGIDENTPIYDLSGQRVTNLQGKKGVYIINGKKVLVK